jgi:ubiquinone/menaquinone biosynthesis C-methylase UbiE
MDLRYPLYRFSKKLEKFIAAGLENSQYKYRALLNELVSRDTHWLDLGCGHQLLPAWMPSWETDERALIGKAKSVTGIDMDQDALHRHRHIANKVVGDIQRLPFPDDSFDLVTANMVVEHVADPARLVAEVERVLRPNGVFVFHTPNRFGYYSLLAGMLPQSVKNKLAGIFQNRKPEDVYPTFYRMNTRRRIGKLAHDNGLTVRQIQLLESSAQTYVVPPLAFLELLLIRLLRSRVLEGCRADLIAVLEKPRTASGLDMPSKQGTLVSAA